MKIVFLNTWNGKQKEDLVEYLAKEVKDTDIFCLQETLDISRPLLADVLHDFKEVHAEKQAERAMYGVSIYVKKGIAIHDTQSFFVENPKLGVAQHICIEKDGQMIDICNIHGITYHKDIKMDTPERLEQTEQILAFYKDRSYLRIIGGDYNILPEAQSIRAFPESGLRDLIMEYKIKTTRNHLCWDRYDGHKMYYSDYVFTSPEIEVTSFTVPETEASDHLPMVLEIKI